MPIDASPDENVDEADRAPRDWVGRTWAEIERDLRASLRGQSSEVVRRELAAERLVFDRYLASRETAERRQQEVETALRPMTNEQRDRYLQGIKRFSWT